MQEALWLVAFVCELSVPCSVERECWNISFYNRHVVMNLALVYSWLWVYQPVTSHENTISVSIPFPQKSFAFGSHLWDPFRLQTSSYTHLTIWIAISLSSSISDSLALLLASIVSLQFLHHRTFMIWRNGFLHWNWLPVSVLPATKFDYPNKLVWRQHLSSEDKTHARPFVFY